MLREVSIHGTSDEQLSGGPASGLSSSNFFWRSGHPIPPGLHTSVRPWNAPVSLTLPTGAVTQEVVVQCIGLTGMRVLIQICFSYFLVDTAGMVVTSQEGVFRSNCMDCLDRTNVIQSLLARRSLQAQLQVHTLCLSY